MSRKYKNEPTALDGIIFQSRKEAARYGELKLLVRMGLIHDLELQPRFPLVVNGIKVCEYRADFGYATKDGKKVIEDVKGVRTAVFSLKAKLFHALNKDLRITEL